MKPSSIAPSTVKKAQEILHNRHRWTFAETLFWVLPFLAYLLFSGFFPGLNNKHLLLSEMAILALFALSFDLILGYAGLISLGHGAFFGLGAYTAGLLAQGGEDHTFWNDPLIGLMSAALVTGILGALTGLFLRKGSDMTRVMMTLGFAMIVQESLQQARDFTGGSDGLEGMRSAPLFGLFPFDIGGHVAALYSLAVLCLLFFFIRRLIFSPFGLSLQALRLNPLRAQSLGLSTAHRLVAIYSLSALLAGIAGALLAQTTQFASLDMVAFHRSADVMLMLLLGGAGRLYGGIIGAFIFRFFQDQLNALTPHYWMFWIGMALMGLVLLVPDGLLGVTERSSSRASPPSRRE